MSKSTNTAPSQSEPNRDEATADRAPSPRLSPVGEALRTLYAWPGPFATIYFDLIEPERDRRWSLVESQLQQSAATAPMIETARTAIVDGQHPEDVGAIVVIVSSEGKKLTEYGLEPPLHDFVYVDTLPYVAPLLEWVQRRVPHLVITVDERGCDLVVFGARRFTEVVTHDGDLATIVEPVTRAAELIGAELAVVSGPAFLARRLAEDLIVSVPSTCRVVAEEDLSDATEVSDAAVRHVSDAVARQTVGFLRELRFMATHGAAVDGVADTFEALRRGDAEVLLIHDDINDNRRAFIGERFEDLALESGTGTSTSARLVDAAIRSAIMSGTRVHIIPSTGSRGPDDDTAALRLDS